MGAYTAFFVFVAIIAILIALFYLIAQRERKIRYIAQIHKETHSYSKSMPKRFEKHFLASEIFEQTKIYLLDFCCSKINECVFVADIEFEHDDASLQKHLCIIKRKKGDEFLLQPKALDCIKPIHLFTQQTYEPGEYSYYDIYSPKKVNVDSLLKQYHSLPFLAESTGEALIICINISYVNLDQLKELFEKKH